MEKEITDIQNKIWKAYKDFSDSKNMKQYNLDIQDLVESYRHDKEMCFFCQSLIVAWCPVINRIKENK